MEKYTSSDEICLEKHPVPVSDIDPDTDLEFHRSSENTTSNAPNNPDTNNEPQLTRTLSPLSAVGLAFTITNSWMSYAATFGPSLTYGGGVTVLFGLIIAAIAQWVVLLGVCEIVQVVERSGGCYAFTYTLFPPASTYRNFVSFAVGMVNLLGFWIGGVAAGIYTAQSVFGLVGFWVEDFQPAKDSRRWEVYLGFVGVVLVSLLPTLTIPASKTKYLTIATLSLSLLFLVTIITILSTLLQHVHAQTDSHSHMESRSASILTTHSNASGWPDGIAWLLSISLGMYSFSPTGTVVHIVEDLKTSKGRNWDENGDTRGAGWGVAVAINTTMALGLATAVPFIIVLLLGISDITAVQEAYMPSLEAFNQGTGSKIVATGLQSCLLVLFFTVVSTQWVSVSRIAWSLARDNALPYSTYFSHISPQQNKPLRATFLSASFFIIFGLIYIASSTAFNSVVNMATLLVNIAYAVPQGTLLFKGRRRLEELAGETGGGVVGKKAKRRFDLGRAGYVINGFSVVLTVFAGVLFCFPTRVPAEAGRMN
ncbi:amino acid/polyamine transporter I [Aspergillus oleicola]